MKDIEKSDLIGAVIEEAEEDRGTYDYLLVRSREGVLIRIRTSEFGDIIAEEEGDE